VAARSTGAPPPTCAAGPSAACPRRTRPRWPGNWGPHAYSDRMMGRTRTFAVVVAVLAVAACGGEGPGEGDGQTAEGASPPTGTDRVEAAGEDGADGTDGGLLGDMTPPPFTSEDEGPRQITIGAAGDILPHAPVI